MIALFASQTAPAADKAADNPTVEVKKLLLRGKLTLEKKKEKQFFFITTDKGIRYFIPLKKIQNEKRAEAAKWLNKQVSLNGVVQFNKTPPHRVKKVHDLKLIK